MPLSTYMDNQVLGWIKGTTMPPAPGAVYVALFNGDPGKAGTGGTDVTTTVRTAGRVAVAFGAISAHVITSNALCDFGSAAGGTNVTHFGVFDAASGGNMIGYAALDNARTIVTGNAVSFAIGALTVNID